VYGRQVSLFQSGNRQNAIHPKRTQRVPQDTIANSGLQRSQYRGLDRAWERDNSSARQFSSTKKTESTGGHAAGRAAQDVFLARQPILDRRMHVFGHELLHRSSETNTYCAVDGTLASLHVISNAFFSFDITEVVGSGRAFINFTRDLLLNGTANILPPHGVVIEILETTSIDAELLAACRRLQERGYLLAADDVVSADCSNRLLDIVDFVKIDLQSTSAVDQEELIKRHASGRTRMVAEKVETRAQFDRAVQMGYDLFQGYLFGRPAIFKGTKSRIQSLSKSDRDRSFRL
jgi:c-di-GMP-related signal transduction protein